MNLVKDSKEKLEEMSLKGKIMYILGVLLLVVGFLQIPLLAYYFYMGREPGLGLMLWWQSILLNISFGTMTLLQYRIDVLKSKLGEEESLR